MFVRRALRSALFVLASAMALGLPASALDRYNHYAGMNPPSAAFDLEQRYIRLGFGFWMQAALGSTNPGFANLSITPAGGLYVQVAPSNTNQLGGVLQFLPDDVTTFPASEPAGSSVVPLSADPTQIFTEGLIGSSPVAVGQLTPPGTSGQSVAYLVECQVVDRDQNPTSFNVVNSNNQVTQQTLNATRADIVACQPKASQPSANPTTPTVDSGWVSVGIVTVPYATSAITSGMITMLQQIGHFLTSTSPIVTSSEITINQGSGKDAIKFQSSTTPGYTALGSSSNSIYGSPCNLLNVGDSVGNSLVCVDTNGNGAFAGKLLVMGQLQTVSSLQSGSGNFFSPVGQIISLCPNGACGPWTVDGNGNVVQTGPLKLGGTNAGVLQWNPTNSSLNLTSTSSGEVIFAGANNGGPWVAINDGGAILDVYGTGNFNGSVTATQYITSSSEKLKRNIHRLTTDPLAIARSVKPVWWNYKRERKSASPHLGIIAEHTSTAIAPNHKVYDIGAAAVNANAAAAEAADHEQRDFESLRRQVSELEAKPHSGVGVNAYATVGNVATEDSKINELTNRVLADEAALAVTRIVAIVALVLVVLLGFLALVIGRRRVIA